MALREKDLLMRIDKLRKNIRNKYRILKQGAIESENRLEKQYKPLISQLKKIETKVVQPIKQEREVEFSPFAVSSPKKLKSSKKRVKSSNFNIDCVDDLSDENIADTSAIQEDVFENEPLDPDISTILATEEGQQSATNFVNEQFTNSLTREYMQMLIKDMGGKNQTIDHLYGPYYDNETLMVGNKALQFDEDGNIMINEKLFPATKGVYELLFKRIPNKNLYSIEDENMYRSILVYTSAHKKGYRQEGKVNRNKSLKYRNIIGKLFPIDSFVHTGKGLMTKTLTKPDVIYWDNPNELVNRLKLLVASAQAGNNGNKNEIISIISELREGGYIKGRGNAMYRSLIR